VIGRFLRWLLPDDERPRVESEQEELLEARRARDGARAAERRFASERRALATRLALQRFREAWRNRPSVVASRTAAVDLWRDIRHSGRSLGRSPGLAVTIILTVGLGLGATTAMVAIIHAVLVAPLGYPDADRLVTIRTANGDNRFPLSVVDLRAIQAQQTSFDAVAAAQGSLATVIVNGVGERVTARTVTSNYLSLLGLTPAFGRLLDASDEGAGQAVVLANGFWRRAFAADPAVVGRAIRIDGVSRVVVGVLAPASGPVERGVAFFRIEHWPTPQRKGPFSLAVLGRLKAGVSPGAAERELLAINRRIFPIWQSSYQDEAATWALTDLKSRVIGTADRPMWLVLAGVAGVLLIACANAANLLVARAVERRPELVVRAALGASRAQLARVLLAESAILASLAAGVAVLVAGGALAVVSAYGASYIPRVGDVRFGGPAAWWLAGFTVLSAAAMGLGPALGGSRVGRAPAVDANRRTTSEGPGSRRVRRALVAAEFALATPLVIAAALIVASLVRLMRVDVGVDGPHILTAAISAPPGAYPTDAAARAYFDRARAGLLALPGVVDVAFADGRPPADANNIDNFDLEKRPTPPNENQPLSPWIAVSPDFFHATGLTLLRGRLLDEHDRDENAAPVILVDRAWARRFFKTDDVVGQRLREGGCTSCAWTTVVGVVATVKYVGLDKPDDGTVYSPMSPFNRDRFVVIRSAGLAADLEPALTTVFRELDPTLPVSQVATIDDLIDASVEMPRYLGILAGAFALAAVLLSIVGVYGVMAHHVARHRRDIGIRLALGGDPGRIRRLVIANGLRVVVVGLVLGVVLAAVATRLMASLLFATPPGDVATFVAVPMGLLTAAAMACALPARRAARVEPSAILKDA
jgi:predicted permease